MSELGQRLRAAREAKGLTLPQAEEATRIRRAFLEALEEERFEALPGVVYAKGFIRNYAQFLGLDPQACLADYHASTGAKRASLPHVLDEPLVTPKRRRMPRTTVVALFLLVLVLAAGGWYGYNRLFLQQEPWPIPQLRDLLPTRVSPTRAAPTATPPASGGAPTVTSTSALVDAPSASPTASPEPPTATATLTRPSATPESTPLPRTAIPTATPAPSVTPTPTLAEGFSVELRVNALCYVRAVVDGQVVLDKNLNPGENQTWTPKQSLSMRVGNAGGVLVFVNGRALPPLGKTDEAVDVTYTLGNLP